ncbi:hypothetical protein ALC60_08611 [Trachymyrmex zeteki]|uniref:CCHC-type domain-containing protein n=1 Tax=Mycetomoellerius zeteki TaxID=64791 RepID=A0A151WWT2_9HYME|nr:hypothetical protein ALC60_08611 [Trachymyrmex zeteki]
MRSSSDEDTTKRRTRGRPAKNPDNVGKFTAENRARAANEKRARQLRRDYKIISDPEIAPSSASAKRANKKAEELVEEYDLQPLEAIAAVATRELSTLAKSVERSKNIRGDIVRDLWGVFAKLSAALTATFNRASEAVTTDEEDGSLGERAWAEERRRLRSEIASLRTENARLTREVGREKRPSPHPLATPGPSRSSKRPSAGERNPRSRDKGRGRATGGVGGGEEEERMMRVLSRFLPRLLLEMGVVPNRAQPPRRERSRGGKRPLATTQQPGARAAPNKGAGAKEDNDTRPPSTPKKAQPPRTSSATAGKPTRGAGEPQEATWAQVVSRKAKRAAAKERESKAAPLPQSTARGKGKAATTSSGGGAKRGSGVSKGGPVGGPKASDKKPPKLRAATSAAVTITCADQSAYAEVVNKARSSICLKDLGIEDLRPRRALTGALIFEVRGPESKAKADCLAEKLSAALAERDDVRVSRPAKSAELRASGLDDSVTSKEVAETLAKIGECPPHSIKVGDIKRAPNGLGFAWVRCPVEAAKRMMATPRVTVGWSTCRLTLLPARGLQSFRCLEAGHVQQRCTSTVDRSGCCFRCGGIGHAANQCREKADCPACRTLGRPSGHRIGGGGCTAAVKKKKGGARSPAVPPPPTKSRRRRQHRRRNKRRLSPNAAMPMAPPATKEETDDALPRRERPGSASFKARSRDVTPTGAPVDSARPLSRAGLCPSLESLAGEKRKRPAMVVVSPPGSEGDTAKRSRDRPALNPANKGKFTAEARAKQAERKRARDLESPDVEPKSASVKRAFAYNILGPHSLEQHISCLKMKFFHQSGIYFNILSHATNHGCIKVFPILIRYYSPNHGLQHCLLDFYEDPDETAAVIYLNLKTRLKQLGSGLKNVSSYSADNTNVNFGIHHFVYQLILKDNANVYSSRCVAHMLHNAVKVICSNMVKNQSIFKIYIKLI